MGADKASALWLGVRAVDRIAITAKACGAIWVATAGAGDYGLPVLLDATPSGGPVGGILSGAAGLRCAGCDRGLFLAVDAPTISEADLAAVLQASAPGAAFEGLHLPMVLDLDALPAEAAADWPLARLAERAGISRLICPPDRRPHVRGANTQQEREALLLSLESERNA